MPETFNLTAIGGICLGGRALHERSHFTSLKRRVGFDRRFEKLLKIKKELRELVELKNINK